MSESYYTEATESEVVSEEVFESAPVEEPVVESEPVVEPEPEPVVEPTSKKKKSAPVPVEEPVAQVLVIPAPVVEVTRPVSGIATAKSKKRN